MINWIRILWILRRRQCIGSIYGSSCITLYLVSFYKRNVFYFLLTFIASVGTILIGSRVGIIGILTDWGLFLGYFFFFKDSLIRLRWQTRILIIFCMSIAIVYSAIITYETIIQYDNFTLERFSANSLVSSREQLINTGKQVISEFNLTEVLWVRVFQEDDLL